MADEAILRIKLEGKGGGPPPRPGPGPGGPGGPGGGGGGGPGGGGGRIPSVTRATTVDKIANTLGMKGSDLSKMLGGAGKMLGAAGAAAGPAVIALAVLEAMKRLSDAVNNTIRALGQFGAKLISPDVDPSSFVSDMGSSVSAVSEKLFYLSPILGAFGGAVGATAQALGQLMKAMDGLVARYSQYNPGIAVAQAQAEVAQILGDLRRSREAEPSLMRYIQARTELQQRIEDMKIRIMVKLEPIITELVQMADDYLPLLEVIANGIIALAKLFTALGDDVGEIKRDVTKKTPEELKGLFEVIMSQDRPQSPFAVSEEGPAVRARLG